MGIFAAIVFWIVAAGYTPRTDTDPVYTIDATAWPANTNIYLAVFSSASQPQIEVLQLLPGTNYSATNFAIETWAKPVIKWWSNGVWRIEFKP